MSFRAERELATLDAEDGELQAAEDTLSGLIERLRAEHAARPADGSTAHELAITLTQRAAVRHWAMRLPESALDLDAAEALAGHLKPLARQAVRTQLLDTRIRLLGAPYSPLHDTAAAHQALQALRGELAGDAQSWIADAPAMRLAEWQGDHREVVRCAERLAPVMQQGDQRRGLHAVRLAEARAWLALGRPERALPHAASAWAFFEVPGPPDIAASAALALARAQGDATAWPLAERALGMVEQLTRTQRNLFDQQRYLVAQQDKFDQALQFALALLDGASSPAQRITAVARAWQVAERAKSFSLRQAMTQGGWLRQLDPAHVSRLDELDRQLQALESQGDASEIGVARRAELSAERQALLEQAMRRRPQAASVARAPDDFQLLDTLAQVPRGCAVVSWYWLASTDHGADGGDTRLLVFHAGLDRQPRLAVVPWTADDATALAAAAAAPVGARPFQVKPLFTPALAAKLLPAQVQQALEGCDALLVTPHRQLRQLPLHALPWPRADGGTGYLIERLALQLLPTLALPFPDTPPPTVRDVLLLGCMQDGFRSAPLYDVPDELLGIDETWAAAGRRVTRMALQADEDFSTAAPVSGWSRYRVIHLACHGHFVPASPLDASLYLGREALRASELFDTELQAEVVCLSACDLGRHGEQVDGLALVSDEWLGLAMPLFQAGARHVLSSLWQAESATASAFMQDFHIALADGRTPAQAHRQAMLRQLRRPYGFWANWQLAGFPSVPGP